VTLYGEDSRALTFEKSCQSAMACGVSSYDMNVSSSSYDMTCMYPPPHNLVSLHWHAGTASVLAVVQDPRAVHTGRFAAYRSVWKTREVWRERELNSGPKQHFSKVLHVVALYSRDTRVLTFEKDSAFAQGYF
jgi:hypothetical protein